MLRASGRAQRRTGAPLLIHPGRDEARPGGDRRGPPRRRRRPVADDHRPHRADALRALEPQEARGDGLRARVRPVRPRALLLQAFAAHIDMINDAERLRLIAWLIAEGHGRQLVLAHDTAAKSHLVRYGGCGYAHILREHRAPDARARLQGGGHPDDAGGDAAAGPGVRPGSGVAPPGVPARRPCADRGRVRVGGGRCLLLHRSGRAAAGSQGRAVHRRPARAAWLSGAARGRRGRLDPPPARGWHDRVGRLPLGLLPRAGRGRSAGAGERAPPAHRADGGAGARGGRGERLPRHEPAGRGRGGATRRADRVRAPVGTRLRVAQRCRGERPGLRGRGGGARVGARVRPRPAPAERPARPGVGARGGQVDPGAHRGVPPGHPQPGDVGRSPRRAPVVPRAGGPLRSRVRPADPARFERVPGAESSETTGRASSPVSRTWSRWRPPCTCCSAVPSR